MNIARQSLGICTAILLAVTISPALAARNEAHVTRIIRDVKLLPSQAAPKPAILNDAVNDNTAVRTGDSSRSELTFVDLRITRLGANTLFAFNAGGHNVQLNAGSMLLYVPKNVGGAQMATSAVSVAITGTTVIFESRKAGRTILKVFEGGARASLIRYPRESVFVRAGQMVDVPAGATTMPQPVNMNTADELKSPLFADFPPLPSQGLIANAPNPVYPSQPVIGQPVIGQPVAGPGGPFFPPRGGGRGKGSPPKGGGTGVSSGTGDNARSGNDGTTNPGKPPPRGGKFQPPKGTKPITTNPGATPPPDGTVLRTLPQQPGQMAGNPAGNAGSAKFGNPKRTPTPRPFPVKRTKKAGSRIN